jgi:type IV pilus assembly protein PilW
VAGLRQQRGVTLVEWMVSIAIGLVLVSALLMLFAQQSRTQNELQKSSRQIENGRYALQLLRGDIELAGYNGEYGGAGTAPGVLPDPCAMATADLESALALPVQGYDAPTALPCGLAAANYKSGTDILVVRHAEPTVVSAPFVAGQTYLQAGIKNSALSFVIDQASSAALPARFDLQKKDGTPGAVRKYQVHVYYVSPCSVPANGSTCSAANTDDGGVSVPTLKRLELTVSGGAPQFSNVPLVEGIENFQIDYGVDTTGDGAPDNFVASPATVADWTNVMALRVHLLARNNERSADYTDGKSYSLGLAGTTVPANDNFKRHVFSQLMRLVNPSSRRDQ